jgi:hypothetical protein
MVEYATLSGVKENRKSVLGSSFWALQVSCFLLSSFLFLTYMRLILLWGRYSIWSEKINSFLPLVYGSIVTLTYTDLGKEKVWKLCMILSMARST